MPCHLSPEQVDQLWLHEVEIVGDIQTNKMRMREVALKALRQAPLVSRLHHDYQLRPLKQFTCDRIFCIVIQAR